MGDVHRGDKMKLKEIKVWWRKLPARDKRLLSCALVILVTAIVWFACIAPPLKQLQRSPVIQRKLDSQIDRVKELQAKAQELKAKPKISSDSSMTVLQAGLSKFGDRITQTIVGDQVRVAFNHIQPKDMTSWIVDLRVKGGIVPTKADLKRDADGTWSGELILPNPAVN